MPHKIYAILHQFVARWLLLWLGKWG